MKINDIRNKFWYYSKELPDIHSKEVLDIPQYLSLSILLVFFSIFIFKNYAIGISDHNEQIPIIFRVSDSSYLVNDWFVNQTEGFSPRFFFSQFINFFTKFLSIEIVYFLLFIFFLGITILSIYLISYILIENNLVSLLVSLAILFGPRISLGANWITSNILVPSTISIALILFAYYIYFLNKKILSFFILGIATLFQAILGLLTTGILIVYFLINDKNKKAETIDAIKYLLVYSIFGLIGLAPLFLVSSNISNPDIFYILTYMRHPHHYCPFSFPLKDYLMFFGMLSLFVLAIYLKYIPKNPDLHNFCIISVLLILFLGIIGTIFVEIIPLTIIGKLQLFRINPLIALFTYPYIFYMFLGYISKIFPYLKNMQIHKFKYLIIIFAILFSFLIVVQTDIKLKKTENDDLYKWIRENTQENAIFIIPPTMEDFRLRANRAVIVDWKAFPFKDSAIIEWRDRINDITNNKQNFKRYRGFNTYSQLNNDYLSLNNSYILYLKEKYNAEYLVMMKEKQLNFTEIFNNSQFKLYHI